jgi:NADPH-dependent 2,4-dienoyl-CoA reductase/sulfur reductase-like enzyme/rhodanese-related sulfurtransferase
MNKLKIVIVGGVAGGASAATRARRMNEHAEIILLEKDEHVSFANCGLPYHIGGEIPDRADLLVASPDLLRHRFRLDVRTCEEVISIDREQKSITVRRRNSDDTYQQPYDKLVLAPGAIPIVPPMPGADAANVMTLRNLGDTDRIKSFVDQKATRRVTVVGAGFIGLEMVEQLVHRGLQVALVELQPQVLPLLDAEMTRPLEEDLQRQQVALHLGVSVDRLTCGTDDLVSTAVLSDGTQIDTDLVILGVGVRPNNSLAVDCGLEIGAGNGITTNDWMQTSDPDIYAVGDAVEYAYGPTGTRMRVALAGPANRAGRLAGEHAATGTSQPMQPVMGTSIVRVFQTTAAMTGLTESSCGRFGQDSRSVTIVSKHHAGYYPGAQPMTLKLTYQPGDGKVLGAQVVGGDGSDKRIDVIATAMHFGATVRDLAGLDLAYAPPFGAAKDPVHLAAFAACNELDGIETFCPSDEPLDAVQVVDVRTPAEVAMNPLAGVDQPINIPVDELRDRIDQLDPEKKTVVSCAVGIRGHVAARILKQHGFDVANLSGGATVRERAWRS